MSGGRNGPRSVEGRSEQGCRHIRPDLRGWDELFDDKAQPEERGHSRRQTSLARAPGGVIRGGLIVSLGGGALDRRSCEIGRR